jgi:hypothetical protein
MAGRTKAAGRRRTRGGKNGTPRKAGFPGKVAERTGLEPATSGVTGQHSNRLNYRSALFWFSVPLVGAEGFEPPTLAL